MSNGKILYEGKSVLDGAPIVVIAITTSVNPKTGDMIQIYILRSDVEPHTATKTGADASVCGDCPQRHYKGGGCYVVTFQAPLSIYRAYKRGSYPHCTGIEAIQAFTTGKDVRLGSYGDPAAVPHSVLKASIKKARMHTGYTHQWRHKHFNKKLLQFLMVSTETPAATKQVQELGGRAFRIGSSSELLENEIECLSDTKGIQCKDCGLCDGAGTAPSIYINAHGSKLKSVNSKNLIASA